MRPFGYEMRRKQEGAAEPARAVPIIGPSVGARVRNARNMSIRGEQLNSNDADAFMGAPT
jgi:hypothetical protein